jgi:hypothetical protein
MREGLAQLIEHEPDLFWLPRPMMPPGPSSPLPQPADLAVVTSLCLIEVVSNSLKISTLHPALPILVTPLMHDESPMLSVLALAVATTS